MKNNIPKLLNDKGVTAILVALLMIVLLGIAALAVDIGYGVMVKNQLQNAADAAALAGARELGEIYNKKDAALVSVSDDGLILIGSAAGNVKIAAYNAALDNKAAGANVTINYLDGDDKDYIKLGTWDPSKQKTPVDLRFTENNTSPIAVQVKVRHDNISTFFARIFGKDTMTSQVVATASLSAICSGNPSPLGISQDWMDVTNCGDTIDLNKTKESCAGWTTLNVAKQDLSNKIYPTDQDVLIGLFRGSGLLGGNVTDPRNITPPEMTAGPTSTSNYTGGSLGNQVFEYVANAIAVQGAWNTTVIVYENSGDTATSCDNPHGDLITKRFAKLQIYGANVTDKSIYAKVICGNDDPERGCGSEFGEKYVYGAIPALVQ